MSMFCIAEALVMDDLPLAQELQGIADVGIVNQAKQIVVGYSCFLLWCNGECAT